jgi:MoxR-like ATPase
MKVKVGYPSAEAEVQILDKYAAGFDADRLSDFPLTPVLDADGCRALRAAVDAVTVAPEVRTYIASIVRATRDDAGLTLGGSPRASVALFRTARAAALLAGRGFVTPDDVKDYATAVLRHRIIVAPELDVEGRTADDVLQAILARVPAPQ